jgi:hypothetical protein
MSKTLILVAITVIIGFISCKEDNGTDPVDNVVYDTIKPLDYFPAYPGSYWIYDNNDTLKVAEQYEKYIFNSAGYSAVPDIDTLILPKLILNGIYNPTDTFAYVNGYSISKSNKSNYRDPAFKKLLSLIEGAEFTIGGAIQGHKITGKTINADTTIIIGTTEYKNVIMTIQFDYACVLGTGSSPEDCATLREYYAKDVGLIKRESRNYPMDTVFTVDFELTQYMINK